MSYVPPNTLREATNEFLNGAYPTEMVQAEQYNAAARTVLMAMRTFQEGAFWAAARLSQEILEHPEYQKGGPEHALLAVIIEIMDEHAKVRAISENNLTNHRH